MTSSHHVLQAVHSINYLGSLSSASNSMADNTPVLIHFEPGAVLPYPLSNSYAEHIVLDSRVREDLFCRDVFYSLETSATGCDVLPE